jgi:copper(I)-binding protein
MRLIAGLLFAFTVVAHATAAGRVVVEKAWIRTAPPGAMMLAGYAKLRNAGDAPVTVIGAASDVFGDVLLHESIEENGVERMRALGELTIAPGTTVEFAPGGKHFMLMHPRRELDAGAKVKIHISTSSGAGTDTEFVVRDAAP